MNVREPDIENVAGRLEAMLQKARREALAYTLLTVLCTPAFVAMATLVVVGMILWVMYWWDVKDVDSWLAVYTGMTVFLASAVAATAVHAHRSGGQMETDRAWRAGATVFLVLLVATYATPLQERSPALFGIAYAVLSFLVLGLVGQSYLDHPSPEPLGEALTFHAFALAVGGFVVSAYGELFSASWLWVPPKTEEIRIAARVLCRLAAEPDRPPSSDIVENRIAKLLFRLKLVEIAQQQLRLTPKGLDFIRDSEGAT